MKILFVINALTVGGAQTLLIDLAKYCKQSNNDVIVATFRDGILSNKLIENGITVEILGESFFDLIAFYRLIKIYKDFKPDIVHSHLFRATTWARLSKVISKSNAKLVTTIHGSETDLYHKVEKNLQPLSDFMLFPSQYLAKWYSESIRKLDSDSYKVIYPGTTIKEPKPYPKQDKIIIGTLSRLHQIKGIDTLLRAAKILKDKNLNFEINIGGGGKGKEKLLELAKELKIEQSYKFVDDIPNKANYLENLSIFAAPSRKEAFGINICEAMERSLPIISTNVGGIPEVVEDGISGLLCEPDNPESLAKNLEKLVNNYEARKTMGEKGRIRVEKLFNRANTMKEHQELYNNLTNNKKIHFAISSCELGGGERLAINLIKSLQKRGWQVSATCAGNPLYAELLSLNVKCSVASMNLGGILFAFKLLKDLDRYKPNIISSHLNKASLFSGILGKLTGIKCVSHIHGLNKKIYYQFSDRQIAVSNAVKQHLLDQKLNASTLVTINNCIDKPAVGTRQYPERPLNISITAKLHANKGHKWALKAISNQITNIKIGKIHIFGDGPERKNLEELCNSLENLKNKVIFHGFVNDPSQYYNDIDIALLPSLGEGIPLSLLEVMRLGIPCIATNVGGIPEIIINKKSGILIEPQNSNALIEAINKLSNKVTYELFSKEAFERFKIVNNQDKMIDDFEKVLRDLL
ncbi:MAG: glycosyltransferase [Candidatus Riflebacteria bacterium]|nr:glycosyltransferase [Candidatus Riflebacteria bacterium]